MSLAIRKYITILESRSEDYRVWYNVLNNTILPVSDMYDHRTTLNDNLMMFIQNQSDIDEYVSLLEEDPEFAGDFIMCCAFRKGWVRINAGIKTTVPFLMSGSLQFARKAVIWLLKHNYTEELNIEIHTNPEELPEYNKTFSNYDLEMFAKRGSLPS